MFFSFTFAISQNSKRALFVQNNPQKTEKNRCFQIFSSIWDILERNLNAGDIIITNLNKNEHFLCNRIILVMKVLLSANTYCKIFMEKLEQI